MRGWCNEGKVYKDKRRLRKTTNAIPLSLSYGRRMVYGLYVTCPHVHMRNRWGDVGRRQRTLVCDVKALVEIIRNTLCAFEQCI